MVKVRKYAERIITWQRLRAIILALILAVAIWFAYLIFVKRYVWVWAEGTGFEGKTLWDWMQLLIIPVALAITAYWFNKKERERESTLAEQRAELDRQIAADHNEEEVLQAYLDRMMELLLDKQLLQAEPDSDLRAIAESRTLTTIRRLNGERKGILLRFLSSSRLITLEDGKTDSLIRLSEYNLDLSRTNLDEAWLLGVDLSKINLREANLYKAVLRGATLFDTELTRANMNKAVLHNACMERAKLFQTKLEGAFLQNAKLSLADLSEADLTDADLSGVELLGANLKGAKVSEEQLQKAKTLQGATMPDGSKHD